MATNSEFFSELKALGKELKKAVSEARQSKEFRDLEREVVSGVKSVAAELRKSVSAARESRTTARIKRRVGRVVSTGRKEAQHEALKRLSKAAKALKELKRKLK